MITEDYVSFETAKLLKEKGFDGECRDYYETDGHFYSEDFSSNWNDPRSPVLQLVSAPTHQMARRWLIKTHSILLIVDYDYECTDTSYCYKIYRLGEHGKPERVAAYGVSYDKNGDPTTHLVGWRDYERSYSDYGTYEEACEAGIKYCLENLI